MDDEENTRALITTKLARKQEDGETLGQKICSHFIGLGYPISNEILPDQLLGCGHWGCVYLVGPNTVVKVTTYLDEIRMLRLIAAAGLLGHPAYPVITTVQEIYTAPHGTLYAYLLKEVAPLLSLEASGEMEPNESYYIGIRLNDLRKAVYDLKLAFRDHARAYRESRSRATVTSPAEKSLEIIYQIGRDPLFGKLADFIIQAALSDLYVAADLFAKNVGFLVNTNGRPMFEEGIVMYDPLGEVVEAKGLGLWVDYVLDEADEAFL